MSARPGRARHPQWHHLGGNRYTSRQAFTTTGCNVYSTCGMRNALLAISTGMQAAASGSSSSSSSAEAEQAAKRRRITRLVEQTLDKLRLGSDDENVRAMHRALVRDATGLEVDDFLERVRALQAADEAALQREHAAVLEAFEPLLRSEEQDAAAAPRGGAVTIDLTGGDSPQPAAPPAPAAQVQVTPPAAAAQGAASSSNAPVAPPSPAVLPRIDLLPDMTRMNGLYLAPSTLVFESPHPQAGQRIGEYGLFTSRDIEPGEFIIFYTGAFFTPSSWKRLQQTNMGAFGQLAEYSVEGKKERRNDPAHVYVAAPIRRDHVGEDLKKFPAAAINEPNYSKGKGKANVYSLTLVPNHSQPIGDEQDGGGEGQELKVVAFPLFACTRIKAGDELLWNYGPGYSSYRIAKGYKAGRGCDEKRDPGFDNDDTGVGHAHTLLQEIWEGRGDKPLALSKHTVVYRQYDDDGEPAVLTSEKESHQSLNLPPSYHDPQRGA